MKYTKTEKYNISIVNKKIMGPNPLKLEEELMKDNRIKKGAIVMDLGSGQGITSVFLAKEYNNVGSTYFDTGNLEEALRCTQQAVAITEISLPEGHPDRALYQQNLAYLKQLMDMHHLKRPRCTATGGQCAPMPDYLFPLDGTDGFLIYSQKFNYFGSKY